VLFLGLTLLSPFPRPVQLSGTAVTLIFYAVLAGDEGPVVRATIMALIMLGGQGLGRKGEGLNSLALAAAIMLIYNPNYLTDPGFQLSVAATWGLVALIPCLAHGMGGLHPQLRELLLFPVAATIATLPLLAYYFYQVSIVGIAANILVTWFLGLILEIGLIAVSIGLIVPFAGQTLLLPVGLLIKFTLWVLGMMAKVPGAALWVIRPAGFGIACYYLGLLLLINWPAVKTKFSGRRDLPKAGSKAGEVKAAALTKNGAAAGIFAVVLLVSLIVLLPSGLFGFSSKRQLEVDFLDVGQGDSILITTPGQRHYLIDGGPRSAAFDSGAAIVRPFLLNKGIKSLDGIFVTHLHDDHTGGLVEVVETFPIKRIYFAPDSGTVAENQGQWPLLKHGLLKHKLAVVTLKKGNRLNLDNGVTARVLSPESPYTGTRSDPNNNSLVLWLSYGNYNILLTGDIEMEALADLHDQLGKVDVLKQPHHGSKYGLDREAWDSINPQAVIVSVGRNNFGQPAPEILRYWQERGIPVLRTDHDGLVAVKTDGHKLEFFLGRQQNKALLKR
ncbi:MAG TPA: ComEC/Rec2 family competence protein, partial [Desulfobacteria bacterium]|nr:ComEC/Rec2 family competence protein [Desulfobacteria bacterium]